MSDYGAAIFSGKLIRYLRSSAPQVDLQIWQGSREEMQGKLQEGSLDLAFGVFTATDYTLRTKTVFTDTMVSVADKQYCTNGTMPMADWLSHPHILASMKPYEANEIDRQLQLLNYRRRIAGRHGSDPDGGAAGTAGNTQSVITGICAAADYRAAQFSDAMAPAQ